MAKMAASKINAFVCLIRPHQYLKNGFVWLPIFFGYKIFDIQAVKQTFFAFMAFCLSASAIYVINDLIDVPLDRIHPEKKNRPLASGALSAKDALSAFTLLVAGSLVVVIFLLPFAFIYIVGAYVLLNILYSLKLKHFPIIDVVCIAMGFILRVFAGGVAADVMISHWIILITFLSALFLALSKRRHDILLSNIGLKTRKSLDGYNLEFVSVSMVMLASVTIVSYILYTVSPEVVKKHGNHIYMTSFWVILGFLRYIQIAIVEENSGAPTIVLLKDVFLQVVIALWGINYFILLYLLKK